MDRVNGDPEAEPRGLRIEIAPRTILYLVLAVLGVWIALELETVLVVVTVALVMVGTLDPMVAWFERRGFRRGRALVPLFVAISLVIAGLILLTVPPLVAQLSIAAFTFGLLTVFRVENAMALALFAGMTDIIPFIGGYIASFPVIIAVSGSGAGAVVIVSLIMFAHQEFESRILVPRVHGKVLRLPPAIVVVALLVGGTLMGIEPEHEPEREDDSG